MANERPPITEFGYLILVSLAQAGSDGSHGYGILQAIEEITKGLRRYALPSLYESLRALQSQGLIELDREEPESGRLRKYFRITAQGQRSMREFHKEGETIRKSVQQTVPSLKPVHR